LNGQISHLEARHEEPNELYDRRDMIVRDLAQKLGLQITTNDQGHVNLVAEGTGVLVQGTDANQLIVMNTPADGKKMAGSADLFIKDAFGIRSITNGLRGGELGGLLHVRDEIINPALRHLDHVAYEFASRVNDIHKEGVGSDGVSGRALFTELGDVAGAASRLSISDDVKNNVGAIASGFSSDARGDNRAMLAIADLQSQSLLPGAPPGNGETSEGARVQTFNESLNTLVGKIGTEVAHEDALFKHQEAVINQLDNYRQSVSGVSLEEEAVNMMQYQTVFNASAKAMKVGDELFQTILSIKE
jgi:flagellar hook-associated protein 1 FlgK